MRISKTSGDVPVPFFTARRVAFALEWKALWHGRLVGRVFMEEPEINFVDGPSADDDQTGADGPWLQIIRDLFPFKINSTIVKNGAIRFRAFQTASPVDVHLTRVQASIENLGNLQEETNPLVSTVQASGLIMDQARFEFKMTLDPFAYRPTFHLALRILGLDVTRLNELALAYGRFDFERGWFDLVLEADAKEGQIEGYVKPLFRNLKVFSLAEDTGTPNPLRVLWQAVIATTTSLLKNRGRDQFGTLVPFRGDLSGATTADILVTVGNVLRNAFIRAYLPRLESGSESIGSLTFGPPEFVEALLTADAP